MTQIRTATDSDKPAVWEIIKSVIAGGDTYVFEPDTPEDEMLAYWFSHEKYVYVAEDDGEIAGTYWIKANQPGLGSHVANGGYMVSPHAIGKGTGRMMAEHSLDEAKRLGFEAMQFNFVVKSNEVAVRLWQKVGFEIIGEIPDAFDHRQNGLTNAYVMYRKL
ncbi:MAG TPA: GNAT family N-acetyltransferase [Pyrinomonadaceae bacterium]|nr:GNAT family N-acetyltransferase [Pyrinomonadaceae bacterium]